MRKTSLDGNSLPASEAVIPIIGHRRAEISILLVLAFLFSVFFKGQNIYALLGTMSCLVLALVTVLYFTYQGKEDILVSAVSIMVLALTLLLFVSILWSRIPYLSILTSWWLGAFGLLCWILILTPRKEAIYKTFLGVVFVFGGIQGFLALYQFFLQQTLPNGLFLYKNLLGSFLVLQIFVLSGLFFILPEEKKRTHYILLSFLFFLTFVVGVIQSRGVYLSFFLAMVLFFGIGHYLQAKRRLILTLFITLVLAFICAELTTISGLSERVMTMEHPFSAGTSRFLIWEGCLEMIRDYPLWGTGLGTYWLLWPPYRNPLDSSGGYFAHNDYLPFWIEGGNPLLMLALILMFVIALSFYKTIKAKEISYESKIESLSLFAGLSALAIHTFFDFNFYSLPNMILAGLMLGRLDTLSAAKKWHLVFPEKLRLRASVYRTCLLLSCLIILSFFFFIALSNYYFEKGNKLFLKMDHAGAARSYDVSSRLWSSYDRPLYMNASLLISLVKPVAYDEESRKRRQDIYLQAVEYLQKAEKLNPYRPQIYLTRALLEEAMGTDMNAIVRAYEKILQVDPLFFQGRTEYGRYLIQSGQSRKALKVMEEGMVHYYTPGPELIPYYQLTSILRRQNGNSEGAKELENRIAKINDQSKKDRLVKKRNWMF